MKPQTNVLYYIDAFDPVTEGDFRLAEEARTKLGMDVVFLPLPDSFLPERGAPLLEREQMIRLAEKGNADFEVLPLDSSLGSLKNEGSPHSLLVKEETYKALKQKGVLSSLNPLWHIYLLGESALEGTIRLPFGHAPSDIKKIQSLACPGIVPALWDYIEENRLYYAGYLSKKLASEHRFKHSLSVAHLCYRIAVSNALQNPERAYVAGVFHDLGKHCPKEEEQSIIKEHFPEFAFFPPWSYHQFTGEYLAREELGIADKEVLDAIEYHSTGKKEMTPLGQIVYAADKIDPLRGYDSGWMIQECLKDYRKGFLTVLKENRAYLTGKGYKVDNPLTEECFRYYLGE